MGLMMVLGVLVRILMMGVLKMMMMRVESAGELLHTRLLSAHMYERLLPWQVSAVQVELCLGELMVMMWGWVVFRCCKLLLMVIVVVVICVIVLMVFGWVGLFLSLVGVMFD